MTKVVVKNVAEMKALAAVLARELRGGETLLLTGELGSGKTTFTQALAKALGVREQVTSPTFNIVSQYETTEHKEIKQLVHIDLYRLENARESAIEETLEHVGEPGRLTVIEWADKLGEAVPVFARRLYFQHGERSGERIVEYS